MTLSTLAAQVAQAASVVVNMSSRSPLLSGSAGGSWQGAGAGQVSLIICGAGEGGALEQPDNSSRQRASCPVLEFCIFTFEPLDGIGAGGGGQGQLVELALQLLGGLVTGRQFGGEGGDGGIFELFPPLCFFVPVAGGLEVLCRVVTWPLAVAAEVADQPQPPRATVRASSNQVRGERSNAITVSSVVGWAVAYSGYIL